MVSSFEWHRGVRTKSSLLISRKSLLLAFLSTLLLVSCTAAKSPTEVASLFTADELVSRAVLFAPVAAEPALQSELKTTDFPVYDKVFATVVGDLWEKKGVRIVNRSKGLDALDEGSREAWRDTIARDAELDANLAQSIQSTYGDKALLVQARLVTNQVSCGKREPIPSYNANRPASPMKYCQRLIRMQFQIFDRNKKEKVWSGLIYSSNESSANIDKDEEVDAKGFPAAPSVEVLMRDAFKNFAQILAGSLPNR